MSKDKQYSKSYHWKEERNYWKTQTPDGTTKYIVEVDGERIEVSEEIYIAYSQMGRHTRYIEKERDIDRILSLEKMGEDEVQPGYVGIKIIPDVQETFLRQEENGQESEFGSLSKAVASLDVKNQELLHALFVQKVPGKKIAKLMGVSEAAVSKRKKRALKKIEKILRQKG